LREKAFIALGSNVSPGVYLPLAVRRLGAFGAILGVSQVYQNPAVGVRGQRDFFNAAALVATHLAPLDLRRRLRNTEREFGRLRGPDKYAARVIDLDLCLLGSVVIASASLQLPDPEIERRPYLAVMLAELDPTFVHPTRGVTLEAIATSIRGEARLKPRPDIALGVVQKR
jgi:2-amino-4-hydroxy-6-hydroxymethyldihydropteridine diphosphokinase